ncbi:MAG: cadherin-like beta sandwich domain-containing protein, partial [Dehalococcoidia bacterium]
VGNAVILTLTSPADADDVVTVSYTAGANPIQDSAGNDAAALTNQAVSNSTGFGSDFPLCSVDNTVSCVSTLNVSDASTLPTPKVFLAAGLVQVQLMNASSTYELATLGANGSTVYTIGLRLRDYTPRMLIGGGRDVGFTIDTAPQPDHTLVTIVAKPVTADQIQPAPSMSAWPTGAADKANLHVSQMVSLAISDLSMFPAGDQALLTGAVLVTDAQAFTQPAYDAVTKVLSIDIAGPHFLSDGVTAHFGFFEAHLPQALLTNWGVTQPSDITAVYTEGSSGLTVTPEAGGMRVDIDVSYSSGTVSLQQALSTNANLSALALSAGTLSPAFAAGTTAYAASVGNGTTSVNVTPTLADSTATLTVAGSAGMSGVPSAVALNVGANAIAVVVTAESGATRTYTITVTRAAPADNGSGGDDIATPSPAPVPAPTPIPAPAPAAVPAGGGVRPAVTVVNKITTPVSSTEATKAETAGALGRAAVTVPPAALPANTDVSVGVIGDLASLVAQVPPPPGVQLALGFEVTATTADGDEILAPFAEAVALEFTVSADAIPSGGTADELVVAFWNGRSWVEVNTAVTVNADGTFTLAALTDHFTVFAVLRTPFRGTFDRPVTEPGVTAALWRGGATAKLLARVPTARSIWVFDGGRPYGYIAGAPEFANAAFARLFATGILPAGTITFVVLPE